MDQRHVLAVFLFASCMWVCEAVDFGDNCNITIACTETNTECVSSSCACTSGSFRDTGNSTCQTKKALGDVCTGSGQCSANDADCSTVTGGTCVCNLGYYESGSSCELKKALGDACTASGQCSANDADCSTATGGTCVCNSDYYQSGSLCELKKALGDACTGLGQCSANEADCSTATGGTCVCNSGYYESGSSCELKKALGDACTGSGQCSANEADCSTATGGTCVCNSGYYESGSSCELKKVLGDGCTASGQCSANNADCSTATGGTCVCNSDYYQSGSLCELKKALGDVCTGSGQCSANDADCSTVTGGTCVCNLGYYESGSSCELKKALGDACTASGQCSANDADCSTATGGTCVCNSDYYQSGSLCELKKGLGDACTASGQCSANDADCSTATGGTCVCNSGYYESGSSCELKKGLGDACTASGQCSANDADCSTATGGTCVCNSGYYQSGLLCELKKALGDACTASGQCSANDADCSTATGGTCVCNLGYYLSGSSCELKVGLDSVCSVDVACSTANAECSGSAGNQGICKCSAGYEKFSAECKADLNTPCTSAGDCADSNAVCSGNQPVCNCDTNSYDSNGATDGGTCELKVGLDSACTVDVACSTANAGCSGSANNPGICQCSTGYEKVSAECKADLNTQCSSTDDCADSNTVCSGNQAVCNCDANFYDSNGATDGGTCELKKDIGENCARSDECEDANTVCNVQCTCLSGYFDTGAASANRVCEKRDLGESCDSVNQCEDVNTVCENQMCRCSSTYYDDNTDGQPGGQCLLKKELGGPCIDVRECAESNTECTNQRCTCKPEYYDTFPGAGGECRKSNVGEGCTDVSQCEDDNTRCTGTCQCDNEYFSDGSVCQLKKRLGEVCGNTNQCDDNNAECTSSTCQCKSGFYNTGTGSEGSCAPEVFLGNACSKNEACGTLNSICQGEVCICQSAYYDDNGDQSDGNCRNRKDLNTPCTSPTSVTDQCKDANAECRNTNFYYCQCVNGYVPQGTTCIPTKAVGDQCTNTAGECSDPNAECLDFKCTCNTNNYDDNGQSPGGNCEQVAELKVTNVRFDTFTMNSFMVRWDEPVKQNHVNNYQVQWRVKGSAVNAGSSSPSKTTSYQITGLSSGQVYTVTIISINSVTRLGDTRTTSVSKEQATKPNVPGGLATSSNYDARSGNVYLDWSSPSGVFNGYNVKIFDGTTEKASRDPSSSNVQIGFTGMKNGYTYRLEIRAKSRLFESTQFVLGDPRTETFRTLVQVPDPPEGVSCTQTGVHFIQLSWSPPSTPNGIIQSYYVHTYIYIGLALRSVQKEQSQSFNVSSLDPGTFYEFRVYAENEQFNSTQFGQPASFCATTAEASSAPRNLSVTQKTSRIIAITWTEPENVNSAELLGYVVRFKTATDQTCVKEHILKCSNCVGSFLISNLPGRCSNNVLNQVSKEALKQQQSYQALNLKPDVQYDITVSAINSIGLGQMAEHTETTNEEAPVKPSDIVVNEVKATTVRVTWTMVGDRPGRTSYTLNLVAASPAEDKTLRVEGFDSKTTIVSELQEFWNYTVSVLAATSVGQSTSDMSVPITTLAAAPGKVSNFNIQTSPNDDYNKVKVSWQSPSILDQNGILKEYVFRSNTSENLQRNREAIAIRQSFEETLDVDIEKIYFFEVFAVNSASEVGEKEYRTMTTPAGVPKNTLGQEVAIVLPQVSPQQTSLTIKIDQRFLELNNRGAIRGAGVVCCASAQCDSNSVPSFTLQEFNSLPTWYQASSGGYSMYRTTSANWLTEMSGPGRRKRSVDTRDYMIGAEACTSQDESEFCNGPLTADTSYIVNVVVCTNGGCLVSDWYGPYRTEKVPEDGPPIGGIVGGVVGAVVAITVVAVVIFFVMRRKRNKPAKYVGEREISIEDNPTSNVPRNRPNKLSDWDNYLNKMHKDANLLFAAEYEDLKAISAAHSQNASNREENRLKNRYINILPFDHSLVKLSSNGEDDGQDYINANYLPGYKSKREYIGCQGPIPGTIDDFWRMVWEQNVAVIVMLTLCKEGQKVKCEQYWPDEVNEPKQYGEIIVETTSKSTIKTYDYKIFNLTVGNKTTTVKHFHFLNWLDFSANVQTGIMIDFLAQVRAHVQPPDTAGPIIVHCSAGVGRTGTYIALDHLMQFINDNEESETIDIFNMVLQLRDNRPHMVQTEQQYIFIHDCVKEILERKNQHIYQNFGFSNQDEDIYQNEPSLYENVTRKPEQRTNL